MLTEQDLTRALACGQDADAVAEFCERHQATVFRTCLGVLRRSDLAEDAAQETFLTLLRRRETLRPEENVRGWLHRVAHNAALQVLRAERRRERRDRSAGEQRWQESTARQQHAAAGGVDRHALRQQIEALPARWRLPILLRYEEGLNYGEIAAALGIPDGTVASRLHEGLARLRAAVQLAGIAVAGGDLAAAIALLPPCPVPASLAAALRALRQAGAGHSPAPGTPTPVQAGPTASRWFAALAALVALVTLVAVVLGVNPGSVPVANVPVTDPSAAAPARESAPVATESTASTAPIVHEEAAPATTTEAAAASASAPGPILHGRVLDAATGEAIPHAQVRAICGMGMRRPSAHAVADAEGRFAFSTLPASNHIDLHIQADGWLMGYYSVPDDALDRDRDYALQPAWDLLLHVQDEQGRAVEDAWRFEVRFPGAEWRPWDAARGVPGDYRLGGFDPALVTAATLQVRIIHSRWVTAVIAGIPGMGAFERHVEYTVVLTGGVTLHGEVRDPAGNPIGVTISVWPADATGMTDLRQVTADAQGHYELKGLAAGQRVRVFAHGAEQVLAAPIEIQLDRDDFRCDLVVPEGGRIEGVAVHGDGSAWSGTNVEVIATSGYAIPGFGPYRRIVTADAAGRFSCAGLPLALDYIVRFSATGAEVTPVHESGHRLEVKVMGEVWDPRKNPVPHSGGDTPPRVLRFPR